MRHDTVTGAVPAGAKVTSGPIWLVVRRPETSFDHAALEPLKAAGALLYQGVDRLAWWDLGEMYYSGRLHPDLVALFEAARRIAGPTTLGGTTEYENARRLLMASAEVAERNEVICAVGPDRLAEIVAPAMTWLGYDPIYKSGRPYSLLTDAYVRPDGPLGASVADLNEAGVFPTAEAALRFLDQYRELAAEGKVEPLPLFDCASEVLAVGRACE